MRSAVRALLGLGELPQTDAADALALALCHATTGRHSSAVDTATAGDRPPPVTPWAARRRRSRPQPGGTDCDRPMLRGRLAGPHAHTMSIVDCGGVATASRCRQEPRLPPVGEDVVVHTHPHVREDVARPLRLPQRAATATCSSC